MSSAAKASKLKLVKDRRARPRSAPGYPSRKGEKLIDGLTKSELVTKFHAKVRIMALKLVNTLPQSVDAEDLISVGLIGLMDAADRFDSSRGIKFETFAEHRIKGAMLDELRRQDWLPRNVRDEIKAIESASARVEAKKGAPATDSEISKVMGLTRKAYQELKSRVGSLSLTQFGDVTEINAPNVTSFVDPFRQASQNDAKALLDQLFVRALAEEERMVLSCYYYRGLNLREIANILALSESRISQIHTKAIMKLKEHLKTEVSSAQSLFLILLDS